MNGCDTDLQRPATFLISTKYMQKLEMGKRKKKKEEDLTLDVFCKVRFANEVLFIEMLLRYSS